MEKPRRENYWDAVRGASIVAVVAIHALGPTSEMPFDSFGYQVTLVTRQLLNFAVPIFLAVAGYMAGIRPINSPKQFWASRFSRLIPPYLFWTFTYILLLEREELFIPSALFSDIFMGTGVGVGYFVIVLAQMVLLTPLIARIRTNLAHVAVIAVGTMAGLAWNYSLRLALPDHPLAQFPENGLPFWVWYPFYHAGFLASRARLADAAWLQNSLPWLISAWVVLVSLSFVEGQYLARGGFLSFALSQTKVTSLLASMVAFGIALAAYSRLRYTATLGLAWLGRSSYFVYLTHILIFAVLGRAAELAGFELDPIAYAIILVPVTIGVCSIGIVVGRRLPGRVQSILLG